MYIDAVRTNATEWGAVHQKPVAGLALRSRCPLDPGRRLPADEDPRHAREPGLCRPDPARGIHDPYQGSLGGPPQQIRVERRVEILADSGPVEEVLSLPPTSADQYEIRIYEGERTWPNSRSAGRMDLRATWLDWKRLPSCSSWAPKLPDTSKLAAVFPVNSDYLPTLCGSDYKPSPPPGRSKAVATRL